MPSPFVHIIVSRPRGLVVVGRRVVGGAVFERRNSSRAPSIIGKRPFSSSSSSSASPSQPSIVMLLLHNPLMRWYASKLDTHPLTTKIVSSGLISGAGDLLCQYLVKADDDRNDDYDEGGGIGNDDDESSPGTGGGGGGGGAAGEEEEEQSSSNYDWMRTLRFGILGSFLVAPTVHVWYGLLMTKIPGTGTYAVAKRLFCDQGLFAPLFLPAFISSLTALEHLPGIGMNGNDHDAGRRRRRHDDDDDLPVDDDKVRDDVVGFYSHLTTRLKNDVPDALVVGWGVWIPSMAIMFAYVPGKYQVLYSNGIGFVWNAYLSWRTHEGEVKSKSEAPRTEE